MLNDAIGRLAVKVKYLYVQLMKITILTSSYDLTNLCVTSESFVWCYFMICLEDHHK